MSAVRVAVVVMMLGCGASSDDGRLRGLVTAMCDQVEREIRWSASSVRQTDSWSLSGLAASHPRLRAIAVEDVLLRLGHCIEMRGNSPLPITLQKMSNRIALYLISVTDPNLLVTGLDELEAIAATTNSLELID